ncbi:uncharacterized protein A4U43_C05F32750 [Asparagus officinalis]|uniref:Uncharacterized protein n=1 Tax=Asparagus officinalis TaxID=4686 RepID=A0A5P1EY06_ASPOF|nr:uncharacterized protein A4U43_C05F32750 [Asparagus officinalis]
MTRRNDERRRKKGDESEREKRKKEEGLGGAGTTLYISRSADTDTPISYRCDLLNDLYNSTFVLIKDSVDLTDSFNDPRNRKAPPSITPNSGSHPHPHFDGVPLLVPDSGARWEFTSYRTGGIKRLPFLAFSKLETRYFEKDAEKLTRKATAGTR